MTLLYKNLQQSTVLFCFTGSPFPVADFETTLLNDMEAYEVKQAIIILVAISAPIVTHAVTPCGCALDGNGWNAHKGHCLWLAVISF